MQIMEDRVIISKAIAVNWESVVGLKALGSKLLFEFPDHLTMEIRGLALDEIDEIFRAYSLYLVNYSSAT